MRQVTAASKTAEPAVSVTMEEVVGRQNLQRALKRVCANQGSPGVDGMTVDQLRDHLRVHWPEIRQQLLDGQYTPQPVKQVLIPKPDGSSRTLGIPTVVDRFIQQALLQALSPMYDPGFSANSFGFRPGRSAHQAVRQAKQYIAQGYEWVVDIDLEKCFDRINHDILMGRLARRISDKRILRLIRGYLQAGVMVNGVVQERYEGTPQGGPLSPLLSNILLDELDQELERRGHKFCRYADDCNIYVRSERSGKRVMETIEGFSVEEAEAQGQPAKECGGQAPGEAISGVQLHLESVAEDQTRRQGPEEGQTPDQEDHTPVQGGQPASSCQRAEHVPARMAGLLQIDRNAHHHQGSGQLDSPEAALLCNEAVDQKQPHPVPAAEITWRQRTRRRRYRSLPQGAVGTVERQTAESGIVEPFLCREGPVFPP